jgi:hypothetical protein
MNNKRLKELIKQMWKDAQRLGTIDPFTMAYLGIYADRLETILRESEREEQFLHVLTDAVGKWSKDQCIDNALAIDRAYQTLTQEKRGGETTFEVNQ